MADTNDVLIQKLIDTVAQADRNNERKLDLMLDTIKEAGGKSLKQASRDHGTLVRLQSTLDKMLKESQDLVKSVRGGGGTGSNAGGLAGGRPLQMLNVQQMTVNNAIFRNVHGLGGGQGGGGDDGGGGAGGPSRMTYVKDALLAIAAAFGVFMKQYTEGYVKQQQTAVTQFWDSFLPKWLGGRDLKLGSKDLQELSIQFKQAALAAGSFGKFGELVSQSMTPELMAATGYDRKLAGEIAAQTQETIRIVSGRNLSEQELIAQTKGLTDAFGKGRILSTMQAKEISVMVNGMAQNWSVMSGLSSKQKMAVLTQTAELTRNRDILGLSSTRLKEFAESLALAKKDTAKERVNNAARLAQLAVMTGRSDLVGEVMQGAITGTFKPETMKELGGALNDFKQNANDAAEQGNLGMKAFSDNVLSQIVDPMSNSVKTMLGTMEEADSRRGIVSNATMESLEAEQKARGVVAEGLDSFAKSIQQADQWLQQLTNGAVNLDTLKNLVLGGIGIKLAKDIASMFGLRLAVAGGAAATAGGGAAAGGAAAGGTAAAAGATGVLAMGGAVLGGAAIGAAIGTAFNYGVEKLSGASVGSHLYDWFNDQGEMNSKEAMKKADDKRWQEIQQRKQQQTSHLQTVAEKTEAHVSVAEQQLAELKKISDASEDQTDSLQQIADSIDDLKNVDSREKIKPVKANYRA